jgi:hypothetical protein
MRRAVLPLFALVFVSGCGNPESRARAVALDFAKAVKAKDVDGVVNRTATPFVAVGQTAKGYLVETLPNHEALRASVTRSFETGGTRAHPTEVLEVIPAAKVDLKGTYGEKMTPEVASQIEQAMGPDGFLVVMGLEGKPFGRLVVTMKGGTAKVAGGLP